MYIRRRKCLEFKLEAPAAEEMLDRVNVRILHSAVIVVELFVDEDREFKTVVYQINLYSTVVPQI